MATTRTIPQTNLAVEVDTLNAALKAAQGSSDRLLAAARKDFEAAFQAGLITVRADTAQAIKTQDVKLAQKAQDDKAALEAAKTKADNATTTKEVTEAQDEALAITAGASATETAPTTKSDADDDVTKPATELSELDAKVNKLVGLVDQTAQAATKSHDNVVAWGFTTDRDANGKPVPGKDSWADFIETSTTDHTMTLHGEDGQSGLVKDVENLKAERKLSWWPTVAVLIVAFILFWIPLAAGWGAIWAGVAGTAAVIVALITFIATNSNRS